MTDTNDPRRLAMIGGPCCISGTLFYLAAAFLPLPDNLAYAMAMLWPVLWIVFAYSLRGVLAARAESFPNTMAFIFACIAFGTLASMISVQLAVKMGTAEFAAAPGADATLYGPIRQVARMVDLGMDVAWDWFIGASLVFLGAALARDPRFGRAWGFPATGFGVALVVLNTITFPWPPDTRGLFDIGPFIALFLLGLGVRVTMLGVRRPASGG